MKPLRIAIDARPLQEGSRLRGVGQYVFQLLKHLPTFEHVQWLICLDRALPYPSDLKALHMREFWVGEPVWKFWVKRSSENYAQALLAANIDLFHFTAQYNVFEVPGAIKLIVTVHDLIPLLLKDLDFQKYFHGLASEVDLYKQGLQDLGTRSAAILTPSQATRRDLVERLQIDSDKIHVTHLGADHLDPPKISDTPKNQAAPYALFVGAMDVHKNISGLIRGFAAAKTKTLRLVMAGPFDHGHIQQIKVWAGEAGVLERLLIKGFVPSSELVSLMASATMFLFPSWYEGFGFPPLEAMRQGVPVICSDRGALPEVVADAALLINPDRTESLGAAIDRLLAEPQLRQDLIAKGHLRAAQFTWQKTVAATVAAYQASLT